MTLLYEGTPKEPHKHLNGLAKTRYSYELDAIAYCDCGKFFYWGWVNDYPTPYQAWIQVRFWDFRIKKIMQRENLVRHV